MRWGTGGCDELHARSCQNHTPIMDMFEADAQAAEAAPAVEAVQAVTNQWTYVTLGKVAKADYTPEGLVCDQCAAPVIFRNGWAGKTLSGLHPVAADRVQKGRLSVGRHGTQPRLRTRGRGRAPGALGRAREGSP